MSGDEQQKDACLLKLQIGPVQDFIAQARSTRDLWSGSYLISWLMAHALRSLEALHGADSVIFPSLASGQSSSGLVQPLVRWLRDKKSVQGAILDQILTPNLPNILLAIVPPNWTLKEVGSHVVEPMHKVWTEEMDACLQYYEDQFRSRNRPDLPPAFENDAIDQFRKQADRFWQINWQLWHCSTLDETLGLIKSFPCPTAVTDGMKKTAGDSTQLSSVDVQRDWAGNYTLISHRLDARRQTRNFDAWPACSPDIATRDKDSLSGREEAIADKVWLDKARKHRDLRYRFQSADQLGAPNLIKRVWDLAYLRQQGLVRTRISYDSVPGIAAAPWLDRLKKALDVSNIREAFRRFVGMVYEANGLVPALPRDNLPSPESDPGGWLNQVDAQIFHTSTWEGWMRDVLDEGVRNEDAQRRIRPAIESLENLYAVVKFGKPSRYFAVLALDGDQMGTWVSGEKCPLTIQFHRDFSRALATFSIRDVVPVIEKHHGQLIYAGGDDVLAMLSAETVIACANELAEKFRKCVGAIAPQCTASVGIAIAHMKAPLQDVVAAAQQAEQTAKREREKDGFGRNAFAVTLFKRSGELLEWGAKFEWNKLRPLQKLMQEHYRQPPDNPSAKTEITGRFPHIIIERLSAYGLNEKLKLPSTVNGAPTPTLLDIAKAEFDWVVKRQTGLGDRVSNEDKLKELRADLRTAGHDFLDELAKEGAPLRWFTGLFSVEAFINQQRD